MSPNVRWSPAYWRLGTQGRFGMILVTGGAGFIGSNFVLDWFAACDEPLLNLDALTYAGNPENLQSLESHPGHVFVRGDICDRDLVDRLLARAPTPRHRALRRREPRGPQHPRPGRVHAHQRHRHVHAARGRAGYCASLDARARAAFRFLHVSTDEVYGSLGPDDAPFTETHPYEPNSPYSASKAASDHLVRAWHHTYGLPVLTTNCSNNYGPYHFPEKLIPLMIVNALAGKPLPVYGDGLQVRDWLYVKDHCSAIRAVLERGHGSARPTTSAAGTRCRTSRSSARSAVCSTSCGPDPAGSLQPADHARHRPAGPRPPLCDRRPQDRARTRLAPGGNVRDRHPQDGAVVPRQPGVGRARAVGQLPRVGRAPTTASGPTL